MAITWRSLQGSADGGAGRLLQGAAQSMNQAFGGLGDVLKQQQELQAKNHETQRTNNTNAFLDQLAQFRTAEDMQAAISSGAVDQMRQGLGRNIDAGQIRGAAEQRLAALQQQTLANNAFQDDVTQRQQRPIADQAGQLIAQGKFSDAQALLNQHELLNESKLWGEMTSEERARAGEQRAVNQDSRAQASHGLNMQSGQVALQANRLRLEDLQNTQQAQEIGRGLQQQYFEQMDHIRSGMSTIAQEQGFQVDRQGNVITEGKSTDDLTKLKTALREAGVPDMPSATQFLESSAQRLLQSGASPEVIQSILGTVESSIGDNALAKRDQDYITKEVAAIGSQFDVQAQQVQGRMAELEKSNAFLKADGDPYEAEASIQGAVTKASKNDSERQSLSTEIDDVLRKGVLINGQNYDVPPSLVLAAISRAGNEEEGWYDDTKADAFRDAISDMLVNPQFAKQYRESEEYKTLKGKVNELNLKKTSAMESGERKLRQEVGGSYNGVEALQRNLLNRRNP